MSLKLKKRRYLLRNGGLQPKWWEKPLPTKFSSKERKRRREKNKRSRASRKGNRSL